MNIQCCINMPETLQVCILWNICQKPLSWLLSIELYTNHITFKHLFTHYPSSWLNLWWFKYELFSNVTLCLFITLVMYTYVIVWGFVHPNLKKTIKVERKFLAKLVLNFEWFGHFVLNVFTHSPQLPKSQVLLKKKYREQRDQMAVGLLINGC